MKTFICSICKREWPENYCPDCARTIERSLEQRASPTAVSQPERPKVFPATMSHPMTLPEQALPLAIPAEPFIRSSAHLKRECGVAITLALLFSWATWGMCRTNTMTHEVDLCLKVCWAINFFVTIFCTGLLCLALKRRQAKRSYWRIALGLFILTVLYVGFFYLIAGLLMFFDIDVEFGSIKYGGNTHYVNYLGIIPVFLGVIVVGLGRLALNLRTRQTHISYLLLTGFAIGQFCGMGWHLLETGIGGQIPSGEH
jgi:hypothetical protein